MKQVHLIKQSSLPETIEGDWAVFSQNKDDYEIIQQKYGPDREFIFDLLPYQEKAKEIALDLLKQTERENLQNLQWHSSPLSTLSQGNHFFSRLTYTLFILDSPQTTFFIDDETLYQFLQKREVGRRKKSRLSYWVYFSFKVIQRCFLKLCSSHNSGRGKYDFLFFTFFDDRNYKKKKGFQDSYTSGLFDELNTKKRGKRVLVPTRTDFKLLRELRHKDDGYLCWSYFSFTSLVKNLKIFGCRKVTFPRYSYLNYNLNLLLENEFVEAWNTFFAIENFLKYIEIMNVFERNKGQTFYYPCENHPWEKFLILAGRKKGMEGIGYIHAMVSHYYLNYFVESLAECFRPHQILVAGSYYQKLLERYYHKVKISVGGAWRFPHLFHTKRKKEEELSGVLFVTPILKPVSFKMVELAKKLKTERKDLKVGLKLHPLVQLDNGLDFEEIKISQEKENLEVLASLYQKFVVSHTSSVIDLLAMGKDVFVLKPDGTSLDPALKTLEGYVEFVSSKDLLETLGQQKKKATKSFKLEEYYSKPSLENWVEV